jgi:hypothetical protein
VQRAVLDGGFAVGVQNRGGESGLARHRIAPAKRPVSLR